MTVTEIEAYDVGISLQRATAKVAKTQRSNGTGDPAVCTSCGERHERYGPNGRPCYAGADSGGSEPPF